MSTITTPQLPRIDFNKPELTGNELTYITLALNHAHISGDGQFTKLCQSMLEGELGVARIFLTTSCTHALELAALLLDIQPGDEVIVPSFTFVSTINAFVLRGAHPVFIDIRPDTLNMNEALLPGLISQRTRAILPVHYAGVGCEMDVILEIARQYQIDIVEDNAHGLFGLYKGKFLGTFGSLATLSFHETKNFTCGEGGAILLNNPKYIERAEIIREKGTNRSRYFRGEVDKYTWVDVGSSFLPSDILAAFLYAQLEMRDQIQQKRQRVWEYYYQNLEGWAMQNDVRLPTVPGYCQQPYHMFFMILPSLEIRQAFIAYLKSKGILSVFHYLPLHSSDMGRKYGGKWGDCPVTEQISDRLVRLPFYNNLSVDDQSQVIEAIQNFTW
ncbi:MAG: dTDP-4-amino-4,6-dideoxygalactose transaminase [Chloroflexi bacterium RBG_16_52_11]|nr:MAG: dTDP-4-amino-4,6-dideoxygalactose transaminase [Chloroflexi bacterium RBG_16_52_11]